MGSGGKELAQVVPESFYSMTADDSLANARGIQESVLIAYIGFPSGVESVPSVGDQRNARRLGEDVEAGLQVFLLVG